MITLDYSNHTTHATSDQAFQKLIEKINNDFQGIMPKGIKAKEEHIIHFSIVDDNEIKKINKKYRGHDTPTDVVSLSYLKEKSFPDANVIGEVFISIETAEKQAHKMEHDLMHELKFLFVHGVLHVLGYDHQTEEDFEYMMKLTNQILEEK